MTNAADEGRERAAAAGEQMPSFDERNTSVSRDPFEDPAQAEWDSTDPSLDPDATGETTGTGADPAEIPDDEDEIPFDDLPGTQAQPESQGEDPDLIDLGPEGQGDISPEDR